MVASIFLLLLSASLVVAQAQRRLFEGSATLLVPSAIDEQAYYKFEVAIKGESADLLHPERIYSSPATYPSDLLYITQGFLPENYVKLQQAAGISFAEEFAAANGRHVDPISSDPYPDLSLGFFDETGVLDEVSEIYSSAFHRKFSRPEDYEVLSEAFLDNVSPDDAPKAVYQEFLDRARAQPVADLDTPDQPGPFDRLGSTEGYGKLLNAIDSVKPPTFQTLGSVQTIQQEPSTPLETSLNSISLEKLMENYKQGVVDPVIDRLEPLDPFSSGNVELLMEGLDSNTTQSLGSLNNVLSPPDRPGPVTLSEGDAIDGDVAHFNFSETFLSGQDSTTKYHVLVSGGTTNEDAYFNFSKAVADRLVDREGDGVTVEGVDGETLFFPTSPDSNTEPANFHEIIRPNSMLGFHGESLLWERMSSPVGGDNPRDDAGSSVAFNSDGEFMAVGMPGYTIGDLGRVGKVRIYRLVADRWRQYGSDIDGLRESGQFGASVALSADGHVVVVGAPNHHDGTAPGIGEATVYRYNGTEWTQIGSAVTGSSYSDSCGFSVAASSTGERIIIGCPSLLGNSPGYAMIYQMDGNDWSPMGIPIDGGGIGDYCGYSVAMSADGMIVAIGLPGSDTATLDAGEVQTYVYTDELDAWEAFGGQLFGDSVADACGHSVSLSENGKHLVYGVPGFVIDGNVEAGLVRARAYDPVSEAWKPLGRDIEGQGAGNDPIGRSVAISGDGSTVAFNGVVENNVLNPGAFAYTYTLSGWIQLGSFIEVGSIGDRIQIDLNMSGNRLLVGVVGFIPQGFASGYQLVKAKKD